MAIQHQQSRESRSQTVLRVLGTSSIHVQAPAAGLPLSISQIKQSVKSNHRQRTVLLRVGGCPSLNDVKSPEGDGSH